MSEHIITLTTDFGYSSGYVGAMKGVILAIAPRARLVDITHSIPAFNVTEAAFVLRQAIPQFPAGTTHLVVVDPGVGSKQQPVAVSWNGYHLVGPDNGLFALLTGSNQPGAMVVLDRPSTYRADPPSATFHGRDIFAPAAALLATGQPLQSLGSPIGQLLAVPQQLPIVDHQGIHGHIVHIDRFGNCITNIPRSLLVKHFASPKVTCNVGDTNIRDLSRTYSDVPRNEPLLLFSSSDRLEVAVNQGSAAQQLGIKRRMPVSIRRVPQRD